MTSNAASELPIRQAEVALNRDLFLRTLVGHLAETLHKVIGLDEASGFISVVAQQMGDEINRDYKQALQVDRLDGAQVAEVLADLKRRIQGDFRIVAQDEERIVFQNTRCPFGDKVLGRPALCMMTSNVFGSITADSLGYAKVAIEAAIARGDSECRVVVHLKPTPAAGQAEGEEYFRVA